MFFYTSFRFLEGARCTSLLFLVGFVFFVSFYLCDLFVYAVHGALIVTIKRDKRSRLTQVHVVDLASVRAYIIPTFIRSFFFFSFSFGFADDAAITIA